MLIGEVARHTGLSNRMLRHYDSLGLVRPTGRTSGGYREYSDADLERLMHVESLRSLGLSLREVGLALDDPEFAPDSLMDRLVDDTKARMAADAQLLERLQHVRATGPSDWSSVLGVMPEAPLAITVTVSLVDMQPSESSRSKLCGGKAGSSVRR